MANLKKQKISKVKNHSEDIRSKATQEIQELEGVAQESLSQKLPEQKVVFKADSIKSRAGRRGVHNLPDQTNPPMGFDPDKAFDSVFPFLKLPYLQPNTPEDVISFGSPEAGGYLDEKNKRIPLNAVFFGDNLHVLRALPSNCIDLIYIDPPFFSGRNYNQIWGDDNEVRTFQDIWEDGLPSYLVWLNARLWEMRRILKNTGSIYVHCDWHAAHYIKCELDKIFGYQNFDSEIIWKSTSAHANNKTYGSIHQTILFYCKGEEPIFNTPYVPYEDEYVEQYYRYKDENGRKFMSGDLVGHKGVNKEFEWRGIIRPWRFPKERLDELESQGKIFWTKNDFPRLKRYLDEMSGMPAQSIWTDKEARYITSWGGESIGYPTQKSEGLLRRIITASSKEGDIVADFFMGGGTTCAVAQKLSRRFIGCDISRVASSVALNRLINDAEEISGRTASMKVAKQTKKEEQVSLGLTIKAVPDIRVYYTGVYPIEKFEFISQKEFEDFILTCYEARRFTGEGEITGVMNASTTILIGSVKPHESISEKRLKKFVENTLKLRYQKNIKMRLKVVAWVFPPTLQKYAQILENYFFKENLPVEIELIPINSQLFRKRILEHYQDADRGEFLLKFISQASITDVFYKKVSGLKYKFEVVARSNNVDGYLINCQWDFDFRDGRFAESEYALMREQKDGKYIAKLTAEKQFERTGSYTIACRVQDNLGGEAIKVLEVEIK